MKFKFRSQDRGLEEVREFRAMLAEAFDEITVPFDCLVVIRDGIATTQFESTANKELEDLKHATKNHPRFKKPPKLVYIIAQKRNMCKLVALENNAQAIPAPGTVLDSSITDRHKKDFYLVSQRSPQGKEKKKVFLFVFVKY